MLIKIAWGIEFKFCEICWLPQMPVPAENIMRISRIETLSYITRDMKCSSLHTVEKASLALQETSARNEG